MLVGPVRASVWRALTDAESTDHVILFRTRLPRVLLGAVVGGSLGASGAALQALLANPLACPHLLGISGGAAVGGVVALIAGAEAISFVVPLAAFAGALFAIGVVYLCARAGGRSTPYALLLVGVVFNVLASAAIMLINVIASYSQAHGVLFWLMGSLSGQSWQLIAAAAAYALAGLAWLAAHAQDLNLLATGEEGAAQLGVDVERARRAIFVAASLLVGAAVSVSGMISFVGLIVPHLIRLVLGADHRLLLPASFLGGAAFLVWADALARTALAPAELPVGVVTALLGGPFFLFLLRRELARAAS
ncbi:MAG: iron ABC transporter permease [Deltaproteobacteria bacterium]|nr:MAG: iron ABC transporter permease [Deltaproteobacteria bacterium]